MWNGISIFVTIFQALYALIKWAFSINRKTYIDIYNEIEFAHIKRKFKKLKRDNYNYKFLKGAKLLFILKDYLPREKIKRFIKNCKRDGYIIYDGNFDVNSKIIIRKEDEFIEKIINSCKS